MRLVYLSDSPLPSREANGFHVMRMCRAFASQGHDVTLIGQNCPVFDEPGVEDIFSFYGVAPDFALERIRRRTFRGWGLLYGWQAAWRARRLRPDLVYARNLWGAFWTSLFGIPTVFEAHTLKFLHQPFHRRISLAMLRRSSLVRLVVISGALREDTLAALPESLRGRFAETLLVAHDGADPQPPGEDEGPAPVDGPGLFRVGYCGSLYPGKGAELLPALATACPWADFLLIGGSEEALADYRQNHRLPPNLHLKGFLPQPEALRLCQQCDVLLAPLQPTIEVAEKGLNIARWTSPLKIFEYMACGKAILCSDLPVLREILTEDETALFLPPSDPGAWSRALQVLADDAERRERLGREARRVLEEHYTWAARARQVISGLA